MNEVCPCGPLSVQMSPIYLIEHACLSFIHKTQLSSSSHSPSVEFTARRMYRSFPGTDQCSWSEFPEAPFVFTPSPTSSNCSRGLPQMQLDLYDPNSTSFDENQSNDSLDFYAPLCAGISIPPGRGDYRDAFNPSQLSTVNPSVPHGPIGRTLPRQQFVFGDGQSSFAFNIEDFWPAPPTYENHISMPITHLSMPDPPPRISPLLPLLPSRENSSPSQNSQLDGPISLACPTHSESGWTRGDSPFQGSSQVTATPPKLQPTQRSSGRSSKKRKVDQADSEDESVRPLLYFPHPMLNSPLHKSRCFNAV